MPAGLRLALIVVAAVAGLVAAPAGAAAAGLVPGGLTRFEERLPVNVVLVGFDEKEVPWAQVEAQLADRGEPIVRSRAFYGIEERLGLEHRYRYRPHYTSAEWEDDFFDHLGPLADEAPLTDYQDAYNAQDSNVVDAQDNHVIDASRVEKRLIDTAPAEVDTRLPTIFFINWYGRDDFRFHVHTKTGEADPDTGYDFGRERDSRKLVAWGGTTPDDEETGLGAQRGVHRVWFHDLSAGPEQWGGSFNVDDADLDGDTVADYRIPPVWEYGSYRDAGALAGDLGRVVRYVGVNLLFTSSPLYPPYFEADRLPRRVDLDVNTVEGWRGANASEAYVTPELFRQEVGELPLGVALDSDEQDLPFEGDFRRCYVRWLANERCYPRYANYPPAANLFLATAFNLNRILDGEPDYEAALVNYAMGHEEHEPGLLGFADDNHIDGTQSGVFSFVSPRATESGYGLTTTMTHEFAHHAGLSHPHDGYDPATGVDYGPTGETFFAWLGDETNSMTSYIDLNWDFSQFDRDNSARHHAAGFALSANRVAADVLADPDAGKAAESLARADTELVAAQAALREHDYVGMLERARAGYRQVRRAAEQAGVPVRVRQPSHWTVVAPTRGTPPAAPTKPLAIDLDPRANRKRQAP